MTDKPILYINDPSDDEVDRVVSSFRREYPTTISSYQDGFTLYKTQFNGRLSVLACKPGEIEFCNTRHHIITSDLIDALDPEHARRVIRHVV